MCPELHNIINNSEAKFIEKIYELIVSYKKTLQNEKMILEAEEDIKNGDTYSLAEVKKILQMSNDDILNGDIVSQKEIDQQDLEWLS